MSEMCVIDGTGDTKHIWNPDVEDEVKVMEELFEKLKKKNYLAYTVDGDGEQGELIKKFDSTLGKIIMVPPVVGG